MHTGADVVGGVSIATGTAGSISINESVTESSGSVGGVTVGGTVCGVTVGGVTSGW